jgi:hypothetical protein
VLSHAAGSVLVGINYPWLRCGWDFGAPPPDYGPRPALAEVVERDFVRLRAAGVEVVRWFVLADGFNYGTGALAPQRDGGDFRFRAEARLEPAFLLDFEALLALCARSRLRLLPVLIDFHWGFAGLDRHTRDASTLQLWDRSPRTGAPGVRLHAARARAARLPEGFVKGGRADVLCDAGVTARFVEHVLEPLLSLSRRHADAIYAWELINEPEWIVKSPLLPQWLEPRARVEPAAMRRFLRAGLGVIADHGFTATVGFASARALRRWDTPRRPLGLGLNQIHYYPSSLLSRLPRADFSNGRPCLLGELASHPGAPRPWPDLPVSRQDLAARLALARARGYAAALVWSYRATDRATDPEREKIESGIARFVGP